MIAYYSYIYIGNSELQMNILDMCLFSRQSSEGIAQYFFEDLNGVLTNWSQTSMSSVCLIHCALHYGYLSRRAILSQTIAASGRALDLSLQLAR